MKDNNNRVGGSVLPAQYTNYANYLNNFAAFMASNNAPLKVISVQNEPDFLATYDSCIWTGTQLQTFFHDVAGLITNAPVMMPESSHYDFNLSDPTLNDATAAANVDFIGGHLYGVNTIVDYANAHNKGKPTWMTEYLVNDQLIDTAAATGRQVHECLVTANMSAYIWWKAYGDANGVVNASGVPQKRGFVLGQWSRFVRPNDYRIASTNAGLGYLSAYRNTNSGAFAIVAVNDSGVPLDKNFALQNFPGVTSVTPWITSSNFSLAVQSAVTVSNGAFSYTLPPVSVVTFVGQVVSNSPPVLAPVADKIINAGVVLSVTNVVTDPDVPPQTLTFSLLNSIPTNAVLNATNGILTWRPLVSQADSTNTFVVKVTDSGTPALSATNTFKVIVNPLPSPSFTSIAFAGSSVNLTINGTAGPDYSLFSSTNLLNWQLLLTTNPAALPFSILDPNPSDAARFYRLQLGP